MSNIGLTTGKQKEFGTVLASSGEGKTLVTYLLMKAKNKPTIIIDNNEQFTGYHKSLKELVAYFLDLDNTKDFITYKRQLLVRLKNDEAKDFYAFLLISKFLAGTLILNDEIDLTLGTANVPNSHPFYEFCNRGRHLEYELLTTARATQNIPKCLTQQTDIYYIGRVNNFPMLEYLEKNTGVKNLEKILDSLEKYQFIKHTDGKKDLQKFMFNFKLLDLF